MNPINYFLWLIGIVIALISSPAAATSQEPAQPAPVYRCSVEIERWDQDSFAIKPTGVAENGAWISGYTIDLGNGKDPLAVDTSTIVINRYPQPGTYSVAVTAVANVPTNDGTVEKFLHCGTVRVEVPPAPTICTPEW